MSAAGHPSIDADALLRALEDDGQPFGVDVHLRVYKLMERLQSCGIDVSSGAALAPYLVPVLSRDADQQGHYGAFIARWSGGRDSDLASVVEPPIPRTIRRVEAVDRRRGVLIGVLALLALAVIGMTVWSYFASGGTVTPVLAEPRPIVHISQQPGRFDDLLSRAIFGLLVLAAGGLLLRWRRETLERLVRRADAADIVEVFKTSVDTPQWFGGAQSAAAFNRLKRSRWFELTRLDIRRTVSATIRSCGWPVFLHKWIRDMPTYVVFVDRSGEQDHTGLISDELDRALRASQVRFTRYDYWGRPNLLTLVRDRKATHVTEPLSVIARRHAGERLIVLGDGADFLQPAGLRRTKGGGRVRVLPGTPYPDLIHLREFSSQFLLVPGDARAVKRTFLEAAGFQVFVGDPEGIARVGDVIAALEKPEAAPPRFRLDSGFRRRLHREEVRYTADIPPSADEIGDLIRELKDELGDPTLFTTLAAIGVFPKISPSFTLLIAKLVRKISLNIDEYTALSTLPWLREGRLPPWLKIALINAMEPHEIREIRHIQLTLLSALDAADGDSGPRATRLQASLEVARKMPERQFRRAIEELPVPESSGMEERIFFATLSGEKLDPHSDILNPEASAAMRERLGGPERRQTWLWVLAVGLAGALATALEPAIMRSLSGLAPGWLALLATTHRFATFEQDQMLDTLAMAGGLSAAALLLWAYDAGRASLSTALRRTAFAARALCGGAATLLGLSAIAFGPQDTFADPETTSVVLIATLGTALWTWFAPRKPWRPPASAEVALASRLRKDDWLSSSIGSVVVLLLFSAQIFLLGSDVERATVSLIACGFGFGLASLLCRYWLVERTVPSVTQLLFELGFGVSAIFSIFLTTAVIEDSSYGKSFIGNFIDGKGLPFRDLGPSSCIMLLTGFAAVRLLGILNISRRTVYGTSLIAFAVAVMASQIVILSETNFPRPDESGLWHVFVLGAGPSVYILLLAMGGWFQYRRSLLRAPRSHWLRCLAAIPIMAAICLVVSVLSRLTPELVTELVYWQLLPLALIFWPAFRFVGPASALRGAPRPATTPAYIRLLGGLKAIARSPWWAFVAFVALFAISASAGDQRSLPELLRPQFPSFPFSWVPPDSAGGILLLAIPVAVWFGWKHGERSRVPVLIGPLLLAIFNLKHPTASAWMVLAMLFWNRFAADAEFRARLLRRETLRWGECAALVIVFSIVVWTEGRGYHATQWFLPSFALVVGASRMPRRVLAFCIGAILAVYVAAAAYGTDVSRAAGFAVALDVPGMIAGLYALTIPLAWRPELTQKSAGTARSLRLMLSVLYVAVGLSSLFLQPSFDVSCRFYCTTPLSGFIASDLMIALSLLGLGSLVWRREFSVSVAVVGFFVSTVLGLLMVLLREGKWILLIPIPSVPAGICYLGYFMFGIALGRVVNRRRANEMETKLVSYFRGAVLRLVRSAERGNKSVPS